MELKVFSGRSNLPLAQKICDALSIPLGRMEHETFQDGEIWVRFSDNIRGRDVYIVQSTNCPHDNLMELFLMLGAAYRASAGRITVVIPYFGYGRQDRKDKSRVPISAEIFADLIVTAAKHKCEVMVMDLHSAQTEGFFDVPTSHLYARPVFIAYFKKNYGVENLVLCAPDVGAANRTCSFSKRLLGSERILILNKERSGHDKSEVTHIVGDVPGGSDVLMVDDMVSTGGTLIGGAHVLKQAGAKRVFAFCTHGVLAGDARKKFAAISGDPNPPIDRLFITDTIKRGKLPSNIKVISVAPLLAEAIRRRHDNESISSLFEE